MTDPRIALRQGPMTLFQVVVVVICTALNTVDGFDVLAMSFTAPLVQKEWSLDPATLGFLLSAGLAGMCLGSLFLSPVADLYGRRVVVILCITLVSIGMFASAFSDGVAALAIFRLLTGLGVGGLLSSGNTLLSEYAPDRWRDLSISAMVVGYSVGAIVGGSISAYLIREFGWRSAFVFGGAVSTVLIPLWISSSRAKPGMRWPASIKSCAVSAGPSSTRSPSSPAKTSRRARFSGSSKRAS